MSLADELLADLEEIDDDSNDDEIQIKEEPIDGDNGMEHDEEVEKMEIDHSVILFKKSIFFFFCWTTKR